MPTTTLGFTLVELAIALMVIGLLIGGVLKGQELIENARIINVVRQIQSYQFSVRSFHTSYGSLPGDILNPSSRLADCTTPPCNVSGNNNNLIEEPEATGFWIHLEKTGLLSGTDPAPTYMYNAAPLDAFGTRASARYIRTSIPLADWSNKILFHATHPTSGAGGPSPYHGIRSYQIDSKMDDGKPMTGDVKLLLYYMDAGITTCHNETTNEYLHHKTKGCMPYIELGEQ